MNSVLNQVNLSNGKYWITGRTDSRPSCPPPISLKQSQQNMSTRSKYTPLRRGTMANAAAKTDAETPSSESTAAAAAAAVKDAETGDKLVKAKSEVHILNRNCLGCLLLVF